MGFWRLGVATTLIAAVFAFASVGSAGAAPTAQIAKVGAAPASTSLHLVLPLTADLAGLRQAALAITTPGSPEYGAYVPLATLARRFGASAQTRRRVTSFLRHAGAQDVAIDPTGLFADATLSAGRAARLFATPLAQFRRAAPVSSPPRRSPAPPPPPRPRTPRRPPASRPDLPVPSPASWGSTTGR